MRIESLLYATLNPIVRFLLRSPIHGIASRNLCLLSFRGRRSGRRYTTPLSFVREGGRKGRKVLLLSSHNTRWWKNLLDEPAEVEIEIAREVHRGLARAHVEDSGPFRDGVRRFLTALPRDARVYGIRLDREKRPLEEDIGSAAGHVVLVEVELTGAAER